MTDKETVDELNKKIVSDIFQAVNYSSNERRLAKVFSEHLTTEHRTLIQSFFRMMSRVIDDYAEHKYYDERNRGSLNWAQKVAKIEGFMPLI